MEQKKPESKEINITLRINELKVLHFETSQRTKELKNPVQLDAYEFRLDIKTEVFEKEKIFSNILDVTLYERQNENSKIELAKLSTLSTFVIMNFDEVFVKENDRFKAPTQLFPLTAGIAISSARGMLSLKLLDTIISNAIIPIINPQQFIPTSE
jgi:hypothetical protein